MRPVWLALVATALVLTMLFASFQLKPDLSSVLRSHAEVDHMSYRRMAGTNSHETVDHAIQTRDLTVNQIEAMVASAYGRIQWHDDYDRHGWCGSYANNESRQLSITPLPISNGHAHYLLEEVHPMSKWEALCTKARAVLIAL